MAKMREPRRRHAWQSCRQSSKLANPDNFLKIRFGISNCRDFSCIHRAALQLQRMDRGRRQLSQETDRGCQSRRIWRAWRRHARARSRSPGLGRSVLLLLVAPASSWCLSWVSASIPKTVPNSLVKCPISCSNVLPTTMMLARGSPCCSPGRRPAACARPSSPARRDIPRRRAARICHQERRSDRLGGQVLVTSALPSRRLSLLQLDRGHASVEEQQPVLVGIAPLEPARARSRIAFAGVQDAGVVDDEALAGRQLGTRLPCEVSSISSPNRR